MNLNDFIQQEDFFYQDSYTGAVMNITLEDIKLLMSEERKPKTI